MAIRWNSLHNHTRYSKLDSMVDMDEYIDTAISYGMDAVSITDHGVVIGCIEFFQKCKKKGIKPILGCEIYLTEDMSIKSRKEMEAKDYRTYHLILLAKNNNGLANLYQIASVAANEGQFDGFERIDLDYIRKHDLGRDLICTSACLGGPVASYLFNSKRNKVDIDRAKKWALDLKDTFEHFYFEVQPNSLPEQKIVNHQLVELSKKMDIPLVISGDTHYVHKHDSCIHDVLLCINTNSLLSDPYRFRFPGEDSYLLHPTEVERYCIANDIPLEAMENTIKISDMCDVDPTPKDKKGLLPPFDVPTGFTEDTYLYKLTYDALLDLSLKKNIDYVTYASRLAYELEVICMKGYAGYFLILWDLIKWCHDNNIMTGPGRGSAAGAITSYLLRITTLDPIEHGLIFERFLDPDKDAFPDIDTDFEYLRRHEVIEYILSKYGKENVAQIITTTKMKLKGASGRIMKAFGMTSAEIKALSDIIPDKMPDQSDAEYAKFKDIMADPDKYRNEYGDEKFSSVYNRVKLFWQKMKEMPDVDHALRKLEGCISSYSIHASGVVIAPPGKLLRSLPTKQFTTATLPVCQFDMSSIDYLRALKLDVLGLKTLSVLDIACNLANIPKSTLNIENYDDYPEVFEMLRDGLTKEVFQVGSPGMTRMIENMQLANFAELTDALALYRPGPLTARDENTGLTMVETYIEAKKSGNITSLHPDIDIILQPTKGCLVYQEQLMQVAQKLAGYTLNQADGSIRKPVGKKKVKEFPKIRQQFVYGDGKIPGAINMGYSESFANAIFDMIIKFGGYGFNKSHSAAYADLSFKTAYLKKHYPAEFLCAVMIVHYDDIDEIIDCIVECKKLGIDILPPSINESAPDFSIKLTPDNKKAILYGLVAIKGIGKHAAEEVFKFRPYVSFADYMSRVHDPTIKRFKEDGVTKLNNPLTKKNEVILIQAGCFDELEENRHKLINEYFAIRKDKKYIPLNENDYNRNLKLEFEKEHIGMYLSDHPLKSYPFTRWNEVYDNEEMEIGGVVRKIEVKTDRNGSEYATATIETLEDKRRLMFGAKIWAKVKSKVIKDARIVITGNKNEEFENIRVTSVRTAVLAKKIKPVEDLSVEIDESEFIN